ncbi:MAG: hypothetical protein R3E34_08125 [Rhodocyclaceae bacterium]
MQCFDHLEGEGTSLVGLLVEEAEGGDLVLVLGQVGGEGVMMVLLASAFAWAAKPLEMDGVGVDVVDDLLALAAGGFDGVAQFGGVEGRAGGGDALLAGFGEFGVGEAGFIAAMRAGGGQGGGDDGVRIDGGDEPLASSTTGVPPPDAQAMRAWALVSSCLARRTRRLASESTVSSSRWPRAMPWSRS